MVSLFLELRLHLCNAGEEQQQSFKKKQTERED